MSRHAQYARLRKALDKLGDADEWAMMQINAAFPEGMHIKWTTTRLGETYKHCGSVVCVRGHSAHHADLLVENFATGKRVRVSIENAITS